MISHRNGPGRTSLLTLAFTGLMIGHVLAQAPPGFGAPSGPTKVGVVTLHLESLVVTSELPGRVSASQTADVRPQVGGIVKTINFQPGQQVTAGDVLFELDDESLQAQVAVQEASVQKAEAAEVSAQAKVDRYQQLADSVSQSDLLDAKASLAQAKADVASANASLKSSQVDLSFAKVKAPISGIISKASVTQGALVTAAQATALATIRLLDPAFVDLVDSSANLLKLRSEMADNAPPANAAGDQPLGQVELTLENGVQYKQTGTLNSADVVVSETTGTFSIRASFPNPDRELLPGMFVRAIVDIGLRQEGFRVPQRAVTFNAAGQATALFAEDGKAVSHVLTTNGNSGNAWIATAGISDGAQLIVDGLQTVSAGSEVSPVEVTLDEDGVVVESQSAAAATGAAPAQSAAPDGAASGAASSGAPSAPAAASSAPAAASSQGA